MKIPIEEELLSQLIRATLMHAETCIRMGDVEDGMDWRKLAQDASDDRFKFVSRVDEITEQMGRL